MAMNSQAELDAADLEWPGHWGFLDTQPPARELFPQPGNKQVHTARCLHRPRVPTVTQPQLLQSTPPASPAAANPCLLACKDRKLQYTLNVNSLG